MSILAFTTKSLADHLEPIEHDLAVLRDELRWVHTNAYWPVGRGLAAPRGASLAQPVDLEDSDHVRGPVHDTGLGVHTSARAWRSAVGWLVLVEMRLAIALELDRPGLAQPEVVRPSPASPLAVVLQVVEDCGWRARRLSQAETTPMVRKLVSQARNNVDAAVRALSRALHGGPAEVATAEAACRVCKIRPSAERKGGRCETCAKWRQRNGFERPTKLDEEVVGPARAAAARRRARGEGWGEAVVVLALSGALLETLSWHMI